MVFLISAAKKNGGKDVTMETLKKDLNSLKEDVENTEKLRVFS